MQHSSRDLIDVTVWTCDTCSAPSSQQSPPPTPTPPLSSAPPTKQISDDSTFNVLQLNANGIGKKLTELEVVLERYKVNVAVIQESKLSPKSKNTCIRIYTTMRKDPLLGGGLLIHSQIDNLFQTAIVTKVAIRSSHGRIFYKS